MAVNAVCELTAYAFGAWYAFEEIGGGEDHVDRSGLCLEWLKEK
jgi:hypothetical protein